MARKQSTKPAVKTATKSSQTKSSGTTSGGLLDYFRFGESYTSLVLGIIVVILAVILLGALFRNRNFSGMLSNNPIKDTSSTSTGPNDKGANKNTYTVKEGDTLWAIAVAKYNDGYQWVAIAKANNLSSADVIAVGTVLTLPAKSDIAKAPSMNPSSSLSPPPTKAPEQPSQPHGATYTVVEGDNLWNISLKAYASGYRWPEIARLNNIPNPDLIYPGTKLQIPK